MALPKYCSRSSLYLASAGSMPSSATRYGEALLTLYASGDPWRALQLWREGETLAVQAGDRLGESWMRIEAAMALGRHMKWLAESAG